MEQKKIPHGMDNSVVVAEEESIRGLNGNGKKYTTNFLKNTPVHKDVSLLHLPNRAVFSSPTRQ